MKRHLLACGAAALMIAALTSCGGSGVTSTSTAPSATTVAGVASIGPIKDGSVTIWALNDDGTKGGVLIEGLRTAEDGSYSADIGQYNGNILVEVTGGTYVDEVTGDFMTLDIPLRAALTGATRKVNLAVTPITELAVRTAGTLTRTAIEEANTMAGIMSGGISITDTDPADISKAGRRADNDQYGLMLATISQMSHTKGWRLDQALDYIRKDFADDGVAQNAGPDLKSALKEFISSSTNKTGITSLGDTNLDNGLDLVSDPAKPIGKPAITPDIAKAKALIADFRNTVSALANYKGMKSVNIVEVPFNRLSSEMRHKIEPTIASVNHKVCWILQSHFSLLNNTQWNQKDRSGNILKITDNGTPGNASFTVTSPSGAAVASGTMTILKDAAGLPVSGGFTGIVKTKAGSVNVDLTYTGTLQNNRFDSMTFLGTLSVPGLEIDFRDGGRKMSATFAPDPDNVSGYDDIYPTSAYLSAKITTKSVRFDGTLSVPEIVWSSKAHMELDQKTGKSYCESGPVPKAARYDGAFAEIIDGKETGLKFSGSMGANFHNAAVFNECTPENKTNFKKWDASFDGIIEMPSHPALMTFMKVAGKLKDHTEFNAKYTRRNSDGTVAFLSGSGEYYSYSNKPTHFSFKDHNGLDFSIDFDDRLACEKKFAGAIRTSGGEKLADLDAFNKTCVPTVKFTDGYFESIL